MRLRELEHDEARYLIFNGWARYKVRDTEIWYHPEHSPKDNGIQLMLDDAVRHQKARDRGQELSLLMPRVSVNGHRPSVQEWLDDDEPPSTQPSPTVD